jgi:hypothetical protein
MATTAGVGIIKPLSLSGQGVDTGLLRTAWSNDIEHEALQAEPLFASPFLTQAIDVGKDKKTKLPTDKLVMDVMPGEKAARDIVHQFITSLSGTGKFGNAQRVLGSEETLALKYAKFYANDWAHGVSGESYGVDFRELSQTQIYNYCKPLLAQWRGELIGLQARTALTVGRSDELAVAPISLAQPLNGNTYVAGLASSSQPSYDSTLATYENNVGTLLGTGVDSTMILNVSNILDMADYWNDKYLKHFEWNGNCLYILACHPDEFRRLHKPSETDSWASYWKDAAAIQDLDKVIPGASIVIGDQVVIVRDRRAPTLTLGGSASDYSFTFGYMKMGRNDTRTTGRVTNLNFNVNMLLGPGCLAKYEPEKPHYEEQKDEYGKYYGVGYFGACSYQLPIYDIDTPTDTSAQQETSALVFTSRAA